MHRWGKGPDRVDMDVPGVPLQIFVFKQRHGRVRARAYDVARPKGRLDLCGLPWDARPVVDVRERPPQPVDQVQGPRGRPVHEGDGLDGRPDLKDGLHVLFRLKAMTLQDGAPTTTVREIHPHTDQVM